VEHQENDEKDQPQDDQALEHTADDIGTHKIALEKPNGICDPEFTRRPDRLENDTLAITEFKNDAHLFRCGQGGAGEAFPGGEAKRVGK
jgi:hypothetical protein